VTDNPERLGVLRELESAFSFLLLERTSHWNESSDLIAWWQDRKGSGGRGWCRCVVSTDTRRSAPTYRTIVDGEVDTRELKDLQAELVGLGALELGNQESSLSSLDCTYDVALKVVAEQGAQEHAFSVVGGVHDDARFDAVLDRIFRAEPKLPRHMRARRQQQR